MKVLVIPEDPLLDQFILKPVAEKMFADLGRKARVQILPKPRLRGVAQALDSSIVAEIVSAYPMVDLFLTLVDRDGEESRPSVGRAREQEHAGRLFVCLAIEEVEIWMLALHRGALPASWSEIRREVKVKDRIAQPFLAEMAPKPDPGEGRAWAMRDLGRQWKGVLERCPELKELRDRLEERLS